MKNDLLSLYLKYDSSFKTISKIALGELVVKIIYFNGKPVSLKYIVQQLAELTGSKIREDCIIDAIMGLKGKIEIQNKKYNISSSFISQLDSAKKESETLHCAICNRYFSGTSSAKEDVLDWFQSTTIAFFEKYNFEWFYNVTNRKKNQGEEFDLDSILQSSFNGYSFSEDDKKWLTSNYKKFITVSDPDADSLFWQYGLSAFSSRLISASSFVNKINIESFRNMAFLLDTNVLMILGLEKHKLNQSIALLEKCFKSIDVKLEYLYETQQEYRQAIESKRKEVYSVFEDYDINVLSQSDCPFISTALHRQCQNGNDVNLMFEDVGNVPSKFSSILDITLLDNNEIYSVVESGQKDEGVKSALNDLYFKSKFKNKRIAALQHDAGLISVSRYLRDNGKRYTILTNDNILKTYASQNLKRNDIALAIGLDVIIGLLTVGGGDISNDSTGFAPLFKNIIKSCLSPSKDAFHVEDLAFMLNAHLEINKLDNERVIEIAKTVNQKLSTGEDEDSINLYLRREIEGERLQSKSDAEQYKVRAGIVTKQRDEAISENKALYKVLKEKERNKIKSKKKAIRVFSYVMFFLIAILICVFEYLKINGIHEKVITEVLTVILSLVSAFPFRNLLKKYNSEDEADIEKEVDKKIEMLIKKMNEE